MRRHFVVLWLVALCTSVAADGVAPQHAFDHHVDLADPLDDGAPDATGWRIELDAGEVARLEVSADGWFRLRLDDGAWTLPATARILTISGSGSHAVVLDPLVGFDFDAHIRIDGFNNDFDGPPAAIAVVSFAPVATAVLA